MQKNRGTQESIRIGDIKGGKARPKLVDNLLNNKNKLLPPVEGKNPIYIIGNLTNEYYFPVTKDDVKKALKKLPTSHVENLTHIWLRKLPKKSAEGNINCQASYIRNNEINLVVIYPFPKDLKMRFGVIKPTNDVLEWYKAYQPNLIKEKHDWFLKWEASQIKKYYLDDLLYQGLNDQMTYFSEDQYQDNSSFFSYYWGNKVRDQKI